jgi:hypothetical protein
MLTLIQIKTNGDIVEKKVKKIEENTLYKHCNYKSDKEFELIHKFEIKNQSQVHQYRIYGKKSGRANTENKYDLPPPIDTLLLFGTLCIVKKVDDDYIDLTTNDWNKTYEHLFGGFEDLGNSSDEERSQDSEYYSDDQYTEEGYLKDNFVVDDNELEEEDYIDEDC